VKPLERRKKEEKIENCKNKSNFEKQKLLASFSVVVGGASRKFSFFFPGTE
jgi:hypothetical protein